MLQLSVSPVHSCLEALRWCYFHSTHLADDVLVGETDNQAVLGSVVLVLVLNDQPLTGIVVGLSLPAPLELDLVPLEVGLVLHKFNECLQTKYIVKLNCNEVTILPC